MMRIISNTRQTIVQKLPQTRSFDINDDYSLFLTS
jgi:hypothetical protein